MSGFQRTTTSRSRRKPLIQVPGQGPPKDHSNVRYAPERVILVLHEAAPTGAACLDWDSVPGLVSRLSVFFGKSKISAVRLQLAKSRDLACERGHKETTCT